MNHNRTDCAAEGCERLHVDDRVAVYGEPERTGTVIATEGENVLVRFDVIRAFGNTALIQRELNFNEAELVKLDCEGESAVEQLATEMRAADGALHAPLTQYLTVARTLIDNGWTKVT